LSDGLLYYASLSTCITNAALDSFNGVLLYDEVKELALGNYHADAKFIVQLPEQSVSRTLRSYPVVNSPSAPDHPRRIGRGHEAAQPRYRVR
jgi:hypothetical protein